MLSETLNLAVDVLSRQEAGWPEGVCLVDDEQLAPASLAAAQHFNARTGRIAVWTGASQQTIFGDAEMNWRFRAWHDSVHIAHALPFTMAGETMAAYIQCAQLIRTMPENGTERGKALQLILCEVIGQAHEYELHGAFPADQLAFTAAHLGEFEHEALWLLDMLRREPSDNHARRLANYRPLWLATV